MKRVRKKHPPVQTGEKSCKGPCGKALPVADFAIDSNQPSGRRAWCRACDSARRGKIQTAPATTDAVPADVAALVRICQRAKEPLPFADLCDRLDLAPGKVRKVLEAAKTAGVRVAVAGDHVGLLSEAPEARTVHKIDVAPVVGGRQKVAVISDLHFGSKYCLRSVLADFIEHAYAAGVREVLCPGDVLDGCYGFARFNQSHHGIDEQSDDAFASLPRKPGLSYHCITGNHDETFTEKIGVGVGEYLEAKFRKQGRNDVHFYGDRGAMVEIRGAVVHLWHPRSGVSYARSYALQKQLEKYSSGEKPQIMLAGHWHIYCHVYERGVHAFACPTFQGGGGSYGKSLGGAPAIGGMILGWELTADGTMRGLSNEPRFYFERERPYRLDDRDAAVPVEVPGVKARRRAS